MFQRFNDNNIESKLIKSLISTVYIPSVQIWKPGKSVVKGYTYITKDYIVKCIKSSDQSTPTSALDSNYFDMVKPYVFGQFYPGLTTNFVSNVSYYDSLTHFYLGRYLRMVRDLYGMDLMPYYNCWCGEFSDNIRIGNLVSDSNSSWYIGEFTETFDKKDDGMRLLLVPIKPNQKYTIYMNCSNRIKLSHLYYSNNKILGSVANRFSQIEYCSFNQPYVYQSPNVDSTEIKYEEYLTLAIQLPESAATHVLVLEGDYSKNKLCSYSSGNTRVVNKIQRVDKFYDDEYLVDANGIVQEIKGDGDGDGLIGTARHLYASQSVDDYCKVVSSLTRTVSNASYAFNSRLLEYLLWNVVSPQDTISKNVQRTQEYVGSYEHLKQNGSQYSGGIKGVWDDNLRLYLYKLVTENKKDFKSVDISGYVDKDVESIITRGQNV